MYALYADASLYFAADRPPAFKYLWFLGEQRIPGALGELHDILAGPKAPRYVVVYQPPRSMPGAVAAGIPAVLKARYARSRGSPGTTSCGARAALTAPAGSG